MHLTHWLIVGSDLKLPLHIG